MPRRTEFDATFRVTPRSNVGFGTNLPPGVCGWSGRPLAGGHKIFTIQSANTAVHVKQDRRGNRTTEYKNHLLDAA
ncbi:MAG: hypothetical protein AAGA56_13810 [Myxococcota bacterium]